LAAACVAGAACAASAAEPSAKDIDAAVLVDFPAHPHSGFSLSIVHGGRTVYVKGYGYRDYGTPDSFIANDTNFYNIPFARVAAARANADGRTIYAIGSVTKQFTAAAILMLSEQHRVDLDAPVSRYAPEFSDPKLTVRTLLNQRSGIPDFNTLAFFGRVRPLARHPDGSLDALRVSREIAALPRDFPAGTKFAYSNSNYFVLGSIVERVTHAPLAEYLAAHVFRPLGMTRTALGGYAATDDVAVGYRVDQAGAVKRAYPWELAWLGGAGGMTSTVEDLARWNAALIGHRVIAPASLGEMFAGIDAGMGQGAYAMGWIGDALGTHRYYWHNGEVGGFHALNVVFPDDELAFTLLSNNQDARLEYFVPSVAALYFPVGGIERILPHSGVVLVEASTAIGLGALAIALVALFTFRRLVLLGIGAAALALVAGFFLPIVLGFVGAGIAALVPVAVYVAVVRLVPPNVVPAKGARTRP
jgi:CubicO group peptidase (beta-lactamase class C family)